MASLLESHPITVGTEVGPTAIRIFQLTLNNVTVELSSHGASITKILLPNYAEDATDITPGLSDLHRDDVILSYASPKEQYDDKNKPFFGAIVGRFANRIKDGRFQLMQKVVHTTPEDGDDAPTTTTVDKLETYQLDKNNKPNHLHGGFDGFWNRIWEADIVNNTEVQFTLISPDGDQGYPGGIKITATYSLLPIKSSESNTSTGGDVGAKLCLKMHASLIPGETKATPIALAQHSYFNLASHRSPRRILDHTLHLPNCTRFTPLDNTSIPTREVRQVNGGGTNAMDFCNETFLSDALIQFGQERAGLELDDAKNNVHRILNPDATGNGGDTLTLIAKTPKSGGAPGANLDGDSPYGFDHNYVIDPPSKPDKLQLAAVLSHPPTRRSLRVSTSAPGMQLYTSNYLDLCPHFARTERPIHSGREFVLKLRHIQTQFILVMMI